MTLMDEVADVPYFTDIQFKPHPESDEYEVVFSNGMRCTISANVYRDLHDPYHPMSVTDLVRLAKNAYRRSYVEDLKEKEHDFVALSEQEFNHKYGKEMRNDSRLYTANPRQQTFRPSQPHTINDTNAQVTITDLSGTYPVTKSASATSVSRKAAQWDKVAEAWADFKRLDYDIDEAAEMLYDLVSELVEEIRTPE